MKFYKKFKRKKLVKCATEVARLHKAASVSSSSSRSSFLFALDRHFSKDIFSFGLT